MGWEWSYCRTPGCDRGLRRASMREVLDEVQYCASGHANTPNVLKDELLAELFERVEALEEKIGGI